MGETLKVNRVQQELEALYRRYGGLDPAKVVDWARKHKRSALHERFDWNDTRAAQQYRLWQARELITEVEVIYPDGKRRQVYVSPIAARGNIGYSALVDVLRDEKTRAEFLRQALDEYRRVGAKYADLKELAGVRAAVERVSAGTKRRKRAV